MFKSYKITKISCYVGYVVQAVVNNFLPLLFVIFMSDYGLTYRQISSLIVINFAVQIAVDLLSMRISRRLGYRGTVLLSHFLCAFGFVLLSFLPKVMNCYLALALSIVIYASGSGIIEVMVSPIMEYLPTKNKSGNMALLHSFYCWGSAFCVILSTFLLKLCGSANWSLVPLIWAIIPTVNIFLFAKVPIVTPKAENGGKSVKELFSSPLFLIFAVLMICSGATEITVAEWISAFMETALGFDKQLGDVLGPCGFALAMGIGRVTFSKFGDKLPLNKILMAMAFICFISYLILGITDVAVLSLVCCIVIGLCVSVMWPGVYSIAAKSIPDGATNMFSLLAFFGDIGCASGPFLLGIVAADSTLKIGFLFSSAFPFIMALLLYFTKKHFISDKEGVKV